MPCLREIADHIGVSKGRAGQLKQLGMPVHSLRAAKQWRTRQPLRRAPTNAKGSCKFAAVKLGRGRRLRRRVEPSNTGNTLEDVLNDTIYMSKEAFNLFEDARLEGDDNRIAHTMRVSLAALHMRLKAEKLAREEAERRGVLVNRHEILQMCRRCLDTVLKRLRRLPQETGPQCNPLEPVLAYEILQRAVNEILVAGQEALTDLA